MHCVPLPSLPLVAVAVHVLVELPEVPGVVGAAVLPRVVAVERRRDPGLALQRRAVIFYELTSARYIS